MRTILLSSALVLSLGCGMTTTLLGQETSDYKIAPLDTLIINVVGEKDLLGEYRVSRTGTIDYPFLAQVEVQGKTAAEIKELITELLDKDYLVNPQVTVGIKEYHVREIFVNGHVNKAGSIVLPGEASLTIQDALGRAGGLTSRGNPSKIKFTRPGKIERTFSLDELKKETDKSKIIMLEPGDVIEVVDKLF